MAEKDFSEMSHVERCKHLREENEKLMKRVEENKKKIEGEKEKANG